MSEDDTSGMFRNRWHDLGLLEVCREFFPDGEPAGLYIRAQKVWDGKKVVITHEKGCWLNNLGVQSMINILEGETRYVGDRMLRPSDPHRFCNDKFVPIKDLLKGDKSSVVKK